MLNVKWGSSNGVEPHLRAGNRRIFGQNRFGAALQNKIDAVDDISRFLTGNAA